MIETFGDALKTMTVGDVHVSTSLPDVSTAYLEPSGNEDDLDDKEMDNDALSFVEMLETVNQSNPPAKQKRYSTFRAVIEIAKTDPDQRKIFGWASVSAVDGNEIIDKQGDIIPITELEKAAHDFTLYSRTQGDMHADIGVGRLIESAVYNAEKRACGIVAKDAEGRVIDGWWVGFQVDSEACWQAHKRGERPEFSIGGLAAWDDV